ncbi:MAG: hypothetical protein K0S47_1899 [Herbinix sp.]|jgi:cytidyltransferase-like protein|nr:hypothetical protein [Herbinix sp.]
MKVVGLITEYNPFHNGHLYHIREAKRITEADYVIVVMSGNFVQRGAPAMIDKYSRTEMALHNGADLVLELPVCYATGSAEYFAHGAVALLHQLRVVDYLVFGSEIGDINLLTKTAELLVSQSEAIDAFISDAMKEGYTYPAARSQAVMRYLSVDQPISQKAMIEVLSSPNNILGIEYIKALKRLSSNIIPITIQRQSASYHDSSLGSEINSNVPQHSGAYHLMAEETTSHESYVISSATAIRNAISNVNDYEQLALIQSSVPKDVYDILLNKYNQTFPITEEDFSSIIKYKLLSENSKTLTNYLDITSDLADRLKNLKNWNVTIAQLNKEIKTKNITLTRISRALTHLLLNLHNDSMKDYIEHGYVFYARVLGIRNKSSKLLRLISNINNIPVITKVTKAETQLCALGLQMLSEDLFAAHIYNQAVYERYSTTILNEYRHGICIL